jgi:hypothetical protein
MAWRVALVVAWVAALFGLVALSEALYVAAGAILTAAVGALIDRWWAVAVPAIVTVLLVGGIFLLIGGCDDDCGGDDGFLAIVLWFLVVFTAPATALMTIGVGLRRAARLARRGSPPRARPAP